MRWALVLALVGVAGCRETQHCGPGLYGRNCDQLLSPGVDVGPRDASMDVGEVDGGADVGVDAGLDGGECARCTASEVCLEADGGEPSCVECIDDGDCEERGPDGGMLDGGVPIGRAICSATHACGFGCTTAADCGGDPCRPDGQCSAYSAGQTQCMSCDTEANCPADSDCVETMFMGGTDGFHCLRRQSGACSAPYPVAQMRRSVEDGTMAPYCTPVESLTTCAAVLAMLASDECTDPSQCAARGARCEDVGGGSLGCTYACSAPIQCPAGFMCPSDFCRL